MSQESSNTDGVLSLLAGVAVGALVGAAVALLTAPQSGAETRTQIRETADDTLGKIKESVEELRAKLDDVLHRRSQSEAAASLESVQGAGEGQPA